MKFAHYCICGAKWRGEMPVTAYEGTKAIYWDSVHIGEGHAPTDAAHASQARRSREYLEAVHDLKTLRRS